MRVNNAIVDPTAAAPGPWLDEIERRSNLTRSQFLIWLGQKVDTKIPLYNMVFAFRLRGPLDEKLFEQAFDRLVAESDALRTVVEELDGVPMQRVESPSTGLLQIANIAADELNAWIDAHKTHIFAPGLPLFDSALFRLSDEDHVWYLNQHHIVCDAWSTALLVRRLGELYSGTAGEMPGFSAYAVRERKNRDGKSQVRARKHWHEQLATPATPIAFYGKTGDGRSSRTGRRRVKLGTSRTAALVDIAGQDDARLLNDELSLFRVVSTLVLAYLHRISGAQRVALGAPVHNRATASDRGTAGLFIEVFPLITNFDHDDTFQTLLEKAGTRIMQLFANAVSGTTTPQINTSYDVLLNFVNAKMQPLPGLETSTDWIHSGFGDSAHKLRLQVHDFDDAGNLCFDFDFNQGSFSAATEDLAMDHFLSIVDAFIADRRALIRKVDIFRPGERAALLEVFNQTGAPLPDVTLIDLLATSVSDHPSAPALRQLDAKVDYATLDRRSGQLARQLATQGLGPGQVGALLLDRSIEAVVAMLAVLKTGAAYLPLDSHHPVRRLTAIIEDVDASELGMAAIIGSGPRPDWLAGKYRWIDVDDVVNDSSSAPVLEAPKPDDLAYIIYTSGSTGQPKGVQVSHRSVVNYLLWARRQYCLNSRPTLALHTSLAVDLTVTSIFLPLISAGCVAIYSDLAATDLPVIRVFEEDAVDIVKLTPAHLALIRELGASTRRIRTLILGGEDLKTSLVQSVLQQFPDDVAIYNEYGPTEATVGCMIHRFDEDSDNGVSVPIGRPIDNARIYLLDDRRQPVPTGLTGEICIGGAGIAAGYLNRPDLNAEHFVSTDIDPGPLYRTGDIGRWDPGGQLLYLGRGDHQVKIRGARVELAEVEAALQECDGVREAVVVAVNPGREVAKEFCSRCGIPSNYPGIVFDDRGTCSMCLAFDLFQDKARAYFRTMDDLQSMAQTIRADSTGEHDCIVLLSGGKDSTYMIHQVARLGLRVLALTLDNGYISEGALENVKRTVADLGIDHVVVSTPRMNEIFADSLARHSNVCHGCFKTIYTLSMKEARDRGIGYIFTGLSRGQIFETRLHDLFRHRIFDIETIKRAIIEARKVYHRVDDAVAHALDIEMFADDAIFEKIRFVDFYRYCNVSLHEVYRFLSQRAPWVRPTDTGRSTNCLINDVGIYIHRKERGFHNYALPYSWDVRLGHKDREAALHELHDDIDTRRVMQILDEVGYEPKPARNDTRLIAYHTGPRPVASADLRSQLADSLPDEMIPTSFLYLTHLPITATGKVDRAALPLPASTQEIDSVGFVAPSTDIDKRLASIWSELLEQPRIGIHDNFFDLGGVSLTAIQALSRIREVFGTELAVQTFFRAPTIADIGHAIEKQIIAEIEALPEDEVRRLLDSDGAA